jgi:hypothetical protein
LTADDGVQQARRGEERHLRVVGDPAGGAIRRGEVGDAGGPERLDDLRARQEFHRRAERIADGTAEEAAAKAVPIIHGVSHCGHVDSGPDGSPGIARHLRRGRPASQAPRHHSMPLVP